VTLGPHLDPEALTPRHNTVVSGYVRHAAVFPHASLFVTHAGFSGVGAALSFGLPMVCVPLGREQPDNAAHVEAVGAGRTAAPDATVEELRSTVADVLGNEAHRAAAASIASAIRLLGEGARAVDELEQLRGSGGHAG